MDDLESFPFLGRIFVERPATKEDMVECAYVALCGAAERLKLVLNHRASFVYETAFQSMEHAIGEYRKALELP